MIFLEADAERDTTATAATWRVVLLGMHEATAAVAVAIASCNCAPWGRLTCALRHEPDPCQSFCCDAFHRCPAVSLVHRRRQETRGKRKVKYV